MTFLSDARYGSIRFVLIVMYKCLFILTYAMLTSLLLEIELTNQTDIQ